MIANHLKTWHNQRVPFGRDDQRAPSITPVTGRDQREAADQPQGGLIDFSREVQDVTDTQAAPAKSPKPTTIR